mmetsp:Transcript_8969/g.19189  ORF Transcript_8969/g.19189 Transcript_8969/m.19189 type:complete len:221 (+) Transcript_8969:788-1450(+)
MSYGTSKVGLYPLSYAATALHVATLAPRSMLSHWASKYEMNWLEVRIGSSRDLNSTVPTAVEGSMGVKQKKLRGDTTTTSKVSVSITLMQLCAPHPEPRTSTTGFCFCSRSRPPAPATSLSRASLVGSCFRPRPTWRDTSMTLSRSWSKATLTKVRFESFRFFGISGTLLEAVFDWAGALGGALEASLSFSSGPAETLTVLVLEYTARRILQGDLALIDG